jgi:hypothetical protein
MGTGNTISLQSKFVFTFKTILTVAGTLISVLWTYHQFVLSPQFDDMHEDVDKIELKIDKVYDHMIGIGDSKSLESAEKPTEATDNQGTL